jgi:hypothetical protein
MNTASETLCSFESALQRARTCRALLALVGAASRWTPSGPAPDARVAPARSSEADAQRILALCWALWEGSSTLSVNELLRLDPVRLAAVGELLVALAGGARSIDEWLARWEPAQDPQGGRAASRRAALSGRLKLTR